MKRRASIVLALVASASAACPLTAAADDGAHVALLVGGTHGGFVRSVEGDAAREDGTTPMSVRLDALAPATAKLVTTWLDGKPGKVDVSLTSAAVVRRVKDARVAGVRLPAVGFGTIDPVEIAFDTRGTSSAPSLRPASDAALPQSARIAAFHVDVAGKPARVAKLGALALERAASAASVTPGELAVEVPAGETQPWTAWSKAAAPRAVSVAYVTSDDKPVVRVTLDGCKPTSLKPTNGPTTRVVIACTSARSSS